MKTELDSRAAARYVYLLLGQTLIGDKNYFGRDFLRLLNP